MQPEVDWEDVDALLRAAAARMGQGHGTLSGAQVEARAAATLLADRRGRAALAEASQEGSSAEDREGDGEESAASGAAEGDGGSMDEEEDEGGEGGDAEEEEEEEERDREQAEEEGAPAEEEVEGQQGPRHVLHNGAIPGVHGMGWHREVRAQGG